RLEGAGLDADTAKQFNERARLERYKVEFLRARSKILEPHEKLDPYRHWSGRYADELGRELAALADVTDHAELAGRLEKLLAPPKGKPRPVEPRVLAAALDLAPRLGEAFA